VTVARAGRRGDRTLAAVLCTWLFLCVAACAQAGTRTHTGMSDASAAVPLDGGLFLVADDEQNTLRVYRADGEGGPVDTIPWDAQLGIAPDDPRPEADLEGGTRLDGHVYWISSHGRNKSGKWRPNRHRFFAMTVKVTERGIVAEPFGRPCSRLALALAAQPSLRELGLDRAVGAGVRDAPDLAPNRNGISIEGLAASADGTSLLIGFANPLIEGKALIVPLLNPAPVLVEDADPEFGEPILLRLTDGSKDDPRALGIRSIEYSERHGGYLIAAVASDGSRSAALFRWSGSAEDEPERLGEATARIRKPKRFTPEALIVYPAGDPVQLLSDDGSRKMKVGSPAECEADRFDNGRCRAKHLLDDTHKTFRSLWTAIE